MTRNIDETVCSHKTDLSLFICLVTLRSNELFITVLLVQRYHGRKVCLSRQHNAETGLEITTNSANISNFGDKDKVFLVRLGLFVKSCQKACPSSAADKRFTKSIQGPIHQLSPVARPAKRS